MDDLISKLVDYVIFVNSVLEEALQSMLMAEPEALFCTVKGGNFSDIQEQEFQFAEFSRFCGKRCDGNEAQIRRHSQKRRCRCLSVCPSSMSSLFC